MMSTMFTFVLSLIMENLKKLRNDLGTSEVQHVEPSSGFTREAVLLEHIEVLQKRLADYETMAKNTLTAVVGSKPVESFAKHCRVRITEKKIKLDHIERVFWKFDLCPTSVISRNAKNALDGLFIRDCYDPIMSEIDQVRTVNKPKLVVLTGVPGIGKSMFSIYYLFRKLMENVSVVVESVSDRYKKFSLDTIYVETVSEDKIFHLDIKVSEVSHPDFDHDLLLVDLAVPLPPRQIGLHTVIFASTNLDRLKGLMNRFNYNHLRLCMPTWTMSEIRLSPEFSLMNKTDIERKFKIFGGVPRHIFGIEADAILTRTIYEDGEDLMRTVICSGFWAINSVTGYMMVHINPVFKESIQEFNFGGEITYDWASEHIHKQLVSQHFRNLDAQACLLFNSNTAKRFLGSEKAGEFLETLLLHSNRLFGNTFEAHNLLTQDFKMITLPVSVESLSAD